MPVKGRGFNSRRVQMRHQIMNSFCFLALNEMNTGESRLRGRYKGYLDMEHTLNVYNLCIKILPSGTSDSDEETAGQQSI